MNSSSSQTETGLKQEVFQPASTSALKDAIKSWSGGKKVVTGCRFKLPESPAAPCDVVLDLSRLQAVVEHCREDQVITVETGITVEKLSELLRACNQWFPCDAPSGYLLSDLVNEGRTGCLEHGFGGMRQLVLGLECVTAAGDSIKCGGKVVKNVTGYDLSRLFTGAFASLAVPVSASLRLYAFPESAKTILLSFDDCGSAISCIRDLRRSGLPLACLELLDHNLFAICLERGGVDKTRRFIRTTNWVVALKITGSQTVVQALENEVSRSVSTSVEVVSLDDSSTGEFWLYAGWLDRLSGSFRFEIAISPADSSSILNFLPADVPKSSRPARNRVYCYLDSAKDCEELAGKIESTFFTRLSVAHPSTTLLRKVSRKANDGVEDLVKRIKNEFDPGAILNPLVSL